MKVLRALRMERCIGCHSCSLACARLVHHQFSWDRAGIRIRSAGGLTTGFEARLCIACDPAACVAACPTGALRQRPGGGVIVTRERCIRCGACAQACPVDAIYLDPDQTPYVCIHCGRCVDFCPHACLELVGVDEPEGKPGEEPRAPARKAPRSRAGLTTRRTSAGGGQDDGQECSDAR